MSNVAKKFTPTPEMLTAAENLMLAQAFHDLLQPIVDAYKREILQRGQWPRYNEDIPSPEIVLDPELTYLMCAADFEEYCVQCNAARDAANLYVEKDEHCPLLVARHHVVKANAAFVDAMYPITGLRNQTILCAAGGLAHQKQFIDLSMNLMVPFLDKEAILKRLVTPSAEAASPSL